MKRLDLTAKMTAAERFFWEHAGYSVRQGEDRAAGRRRSATETAEAEAYMQDIGWECHWDYDDGGCSGCDCGSDSCACAAGTDHETFYCVLLDGTGAVLASLSGICSPTDHYRRVVEAELALEAMADRKGALA